MIAADGTPAPAGSDGRCKSFEPLDPISRSVGHEGGAALLPLRADLTTLPPATSPSYHRVKEKLLFRIWLLPQTVGDTLAAVRAHYEDLDDNDQLAVLVAILSDLAADDYVQLTTDHDPTADLIESSDALSRLATGSLPMKTVVNATEKADSFAHAYDA